MAHPVIDSHCHLDYPGLTEDIEGVLARAEEAGVGLMVSIGTRVRKFESVLQDRGALSAGLVHGRHASAPCRRGAGRDRTRIS